MDGDEISFGPFVLDVRRRALFRDNKAVRVGGRALDILCELASAAGEIVSKDDLMARLWGGQIVEEGNIAVHVSALRKALDNQGDGHSYVITVPGRGYRLTAGDRLPAARLVEPPSAGNSQGSDRSARSPIEGNVKERPQAIDRRQLTVVSCELPGKSQVATLLDAEDLSAVVVEFFRYWTEIVARFGGVARLASDGILACFGYPQASEHDAEQAVLAGLALIGEAGRLGDAEIASLRLGIATGPVIVGIPIERESLEPRGLLGEPLSLATALRRMAAPNTLVIDKSTRRLVGELFEVRSIERQAEADAFEVLKPSARHSRFDALHGEPLTPLVGRKEELESLQRRWQQAVAGEMQVVLISGEAGIGKSRLIVEFQRHIRNEQITCFRYFCSPHHRDSALYPVIRQLEEVAGFDRNDAAELKIAKLKALSAAACASEQDAGLLLEMLSLPSDIPLGQFTSRRKRERTFEALIRRIEFAAQKPVLMVFEDAHWSDPTTLEFMDLVTRRIAHRPILLIVTFRPEFVPSWDGQAHVKGMMLHRLDRKESTELVRATIGMDALDIDMVEEIADRADGVPLFVEELSKHLAESSANHANDVDSLRSIPATLQASLMGRFDRLDVATKEVAQAGAALGREFAYELVADVCSQTKAVLDAALENLVTSGLVFRRGTPSNTIFVFKHSLVQDIVYSTLLRSKRRQLHAKIAEALELSFPDVQAQNPELLGQHFANAGKSETALRYWRIAVERALRTSAYREAVGLCARGLRAAETVTLQDERLREEAWLQLQMGIALTARFGPSAPEMLGAFSRAREIAQELKNEGILAGAFLGLWAHHNAKANLRPALALARDLFAIAESGGKEEVHVQAHAASLTVTYKMGAFEEAWKHFELGTSRCRSDTQVFEAIPNYVKPRPDMLLHGSFVAWIMGYPERAQRLAAETMIAARETNQPYTITHCVYMLGHLAELQENWRAVRRANEETVELARRWGFSGTMQLVQRRIALVAVAMDRDEEQFRLKCEHRQPGFARSLHDVVLARMCGALGILEQGLKLLDEALEYTRQTGSSFYDAEVHRARARLLALMGYRRKAEESYLASIQIARQQSARMWELRAATDLAEFWSYDGESKRATDLLDPLYSQFTEGLDTPDLRAAKAILESLS